MQKFILLFLILTTALSAADNRRLLNLSPALWTPLSSANLRGWGDCSDPTKVAVSGSNITTVTDKSPNAYTWTASATAPTLVTSVQNGLSTCRFAASTYLTGASGTNLTIGTECALAKASSLAQFNALLMHGLVIADNALTLEVGAGANKLDLWYDGVGSRAPTGAGSIVTGTWYRVCVTLDTSPLATIYINAVSASTTTQAGGIIKTTNFNISKDNGANFTAWIGDIGEWAIDTGTGNSFVTNIDTYWKAKWNLP